MNIKDLLKEYQRITEEEVVMDSMEDETGTNEVIDDIVKKKDMKEEKLEEISLDLAQKVNDVRNFKAIKSNIDSKTTEDPQAKETAKKEKEKAEKSNKLFKKWKKVKGYESLGELKRNQ